MDVGNATFGEGFLEHSVETPLNASDLFAVGIYGQISNPKKSSSYAMTVKILKTELEDDIGLHLKDDGLAGLDDIYDSELLIIINIFFQFQT